jgi:hypothetical protein
MKNHADNYENFPVFTLPHYVLLKENSISDFEKFWRFVENYFKRKLSYQIDIEKVFNIILREFSRSFYGKFFYGFPILNFDYYC